MLMVNCHQKLKQLLALFRDCKAIPSYSYVLPRECRLFKMRVLCWLTYRKDRNVRSRTALNMSFMCTVDFDTCFHASKLCTPRCACESRFLYRLLLVLFLFGYLPMVYFRYSSLPRFSFFSLVSFYRCVLSTEFTLYRQASTRFVSFVLTFVSFVIFAATAPSQHFVNVQHMTEREDYPNGPNSIETQRRIL